MKAKKILQQYDVTIEANDPTQRVTAVWRPDELNAEVQKRSYTMETILECAELAAVLRPEDLSEILERAAVYAPNGYGWRDAYYVADMREVLLLAGQQLEPTFSKYGYGTDSANTLSAAKCTNVLKHLRNSIDFTNDQEVACAQLLQSVCDFQNHVLALRHDLISDFLRKIVELTKKVETIAKGERV